MLHHYAPGHRHYIPEAPSKAVWEDVAIIVVPAKEKPA